jgi:hypothetical protein
MELQYNAQLPYFTYSTHSIRENSIQKSQLLGCAGSLQRTLQLSCLRPEYFYLLDIYTKQHIHVDIQLRCAAYLEKHAIHSGIFLILDKQETHAIILEQ